MQETVSGHLRQSKGDLSVNSKSNTIKIPDIFAYSLDIIQIQVV